MIIRLIAAILLYFSCAQGVAQDTFSLLAYDPSTGEIVSAGASCIDGNQVPGGVRIISSLIPGVGAVHTQSLYVKSNQAFAKTLLSGGLSAKPLLDSVLQRDASLQPMLRQYLALSMLPKPELSAFTGKDCFAWAGHLQGPTYVIAGNILLDSLVIQKMEQAFLEAQQAGKWLGDCAMAAMKAAAFPGADSRCLSAGISSRSSFIRLAQPSDKEDSLLLDLFVEFPEAGIDPIILLENKYLDWKYTYGR